MASIMLRVKAAPEDSGLTVARPLREATRNGRTARTTRAVVPYR